jgi:hypothetical protein
MAPEGARERAIAALADLHQRKSNGLLVIELAYRYAGSLVIDRDVDSPVCMAP